ncbi:MAG: hypothetical protein CVU71_03780 [Deltaproteobacteria bacterium HGW-Deltaproteobacteria-6]|jgi:hypothetical protein|nr:MAG: hypothetical protein CVU71_03780 [Deltaproteobacteria bacterium HGW-Deltaproteobacteria-6]
MQSQQLKIDFVKQIRIVEPDDKKGDLPLSFRVTDKFKTDLHDMARIKGVSLSDLCCEYLINSYTEDYKNYLLLQQSGDKTLRDLLR